eukprot:1125101-Lingulodinium_polyedra.AAC.1
MATVNALWKPMLSHGHLKTPLGGARAAQSVDVVLHAVIWHVLARVVNLCQTVGMHRLHVCLRVLDFVVACHLRVALVPG